MTSSTPALDPQRHAASPRLLAVVDEVCRLSLAVEARHGNRTRTRRAQALALFRAGIDCVVANLVYLTALSRDTFRTTRDDAALASKWRYRPPVLSRQLIQAVDAMALAAAGFVTVKLGRQAGFGVDDDGLVYKVGAQTEVTITARLAERLAGMSIEDTARHADQEIVLLKKPRVDDAPAKLQDYDDTGLTESYRTDVRKINAYLSTFDVEYTGGDTIDTDARYLHRGFTNSDWFQGGRLSPTVGGAFWYPMSHAERLAHLTIEGERVASLDFKALGISLAYNNVLRVDVPAGDLYAIPVALHRDQIKVLVSSMLFVDKRLKHWPRKMPGTVNGLRIADAIEGVRKVHPQVAELFFTGIGHSLQHVESSILVDTMLRLRTAGVPALPVHDCFYVPKSLVAIAHKAMVDSYSFHCHGRLPLIEVETAARD
jgi:hypothetical protein